MAVKRSQQISIWIIAIALTIGTLGSFLVMALANDNAKIDQAQQEKQYEEAMKEYQEQQKVAAQANADNSEAFGDYSARKFDGSTVTKLKVEVLKEGSGGVIKATDSINASYFGWTSDGKIFDSSKKKSATDQPATFPLNGVISGWTEGLTGLKAGSVVRLSIPAEKAYGPQGSGVIPANAPLEFIVQIHKIDNTPAEEA